MYSGIWPPPSVRSEAVIWLPIQRARTVTPRTTPKVRVTR